MVRQEAATGSWRCVAWRSSWSRGRAAARPDTGDGRRADPRPGPARDRTCPTRTCGCPSRTTRSATTGRRSSRTRWRVRSPAGSSPRTAAAVEMVPGARRGGGAVAFPAKCTRPAAARAPWWRSCRTRRSTPASSDFEYGARVWLAPEPDDDRVQHRAEGPVRHRRAASGSCRSTATTGEPSCVVRSGERACSPSAPAVSIADSELAPRGVPTRRGGRHHRVDDTEDRTDGADRLRGQRVAGPRRQPGRGRRRRPVPRPDRRRLPADRARRLTRQPGRATQSEASSSAKVCSVVALELPRALRGTHTGVEVGHRDDVVGPGVRGGVAEPLGGQARVLGVVPAAVLADHDRGVAEPADHLVDLAAEAAPRLAVRGRPRVVDVEADDGGLAGRSTPPGRRRRPAGRRSSAAGRARRSPAAPDRPRVGSPAAAWPRSRTAACPGGRRRSRARGGG